MTHPYLSQRSHCRLNLIVILNNQISTNNKRFSSNRTALKFTAPARSCPRYIGAAAVSFVFEKYLRPYPYGGATFPQPPSVSVIEFLSGGGNFFGDLSMENLESNSAAEQTENRDDTNVSREDFGALQHGCEHYRRRCKLRAPCCDQIFTCRHCHNEATSILSNPDDRHELVRPDVKQVVCAICNTEQQVSNLCSNCGVKFGEYFCNICKFYDDDITKEQFHCNDCGICRVGGRENFFHCPKCGSCYSVGLRNNHRCVENSMKSHCPICYEFLFDSTMQTTIMKCGHTIHVECYEEMFNQNQYRCPICSKSVLNMSSTWERLDQEIAATAMPEEYRYEVEILCNDCNSTSKALFHIFGHKCQHCNSYNTRVITSREN